MIRRPPRSTRTDTLFPYTTLFRSCLGCLLCGFLLSNRMVWHDSGPRSNKNYVCGPFRIDPSICFHFPRQTSKETTMKRISNIMATALVATGMAVVSTAAIAQSPEQYAPIFSYRTGPYAPNGIPVANGTSDYLKLVNAHGGINGVKFKIEECEFAYDTSKGIEDRKSVVSGKSG